MNENLENCEKFYEESFKDDTIADEDSFEDDASADDLWREELTSLERDIWLQKEVYLRERLSQQLLSLSQDLSALQPQHRHPHHHQQRPHLPHHLWGHQTLQWRPPSQAQRSRTRKTRRPERLRRWIMRRMPML